MIGIQEVITESRNTKTCRKKRKKTYTVLPAEGFSSPLLHCEVVRNVLFISISDK